jgi:glycine cleavage system H protein
MAYKTPEGQYYSREHEWVKREGNLARVGLTDYAQSKLGDIVYVELPELSKQVKQVAEPKTKEMEIGAAESIKAVSSIYAPVSGAVKEVNEGLRDKPELLNTHPYDDGWICTIESGSLDQEFKGLMDAKAYSDYIKKLE